MRAASRAIDSVSASRGTWSRRATRSRQQPSTLATSRKQAGSKCRDRPLSRGQIPVEILLTLPAGAHDAPHTLAVRESSPAPKRTGVRLLDPLDHAAGREMLL